MYTYSKTNKWHYFFIHFLWYLWIWLSVVLFIHLRAHLIFWMFQCYHTVLCFSLWIIEVFFFLYYFFVVVNLKQCLGASEIGQQLKTLLTKPENLNSVPETSIVERERKIRVCGCAPVFSPQIYIAAIFTLLIVET